jgi:hypothetical protein
MHFVWLRAEGEYSYLQMQFPEIIAWKILRMLYPRGHKICIKRHTGVWVDYENCGATSKAGTHYAAPAGKKFYMKKMWGARIPVCTLPGEYFMLYSQQHLARSSIRKVFAVCGAFCSQILCESAVPYESIFHAMKTFFQYFMLDLHQIIKIIWHTFVVLCFHLNIIFGAC